MVVRRGEGEVDEGDVVEGDVVEGDVVEGDVVDDGAELHAIGGATAIHAATRPPRARRAAAGPIRPDGVREVEFGRKPR
jgi:hypothetical protein